MAARLALVAQGVLLAGLPLAGGHSYLFEPVSRNMAYSAENCPHCGQGGGVSVVKERANGRWPTKDEYGSHGLCGNPFQGQAVTALQDERYLVHTTVPQRTYTAGMSVGFLVFISTHHGGHFEFRICDRKLDASLASYQEGQECLDQWVLERVPPEEAYGDCDVNDARGDCQPVDANHPGRWYLPPTSMMETTPGAGWSDLANETFTSNGASGSFYFMWYKIPEDLACTHCTLQWYWSSGNNCVYDADYFTYFKGIQELGWDAGSWSAFSVADWATCENRCCGNAGLWGEEFWNCADIKVVASGPTPPPTPAPTNKVTLSPTWQPTQPPSPTHAPTPQPTLPPSPPTTPSPTLEATEVLQCFNRQCGCPGAWQADWCTVDSAKFGGWCQESEANCNTCDATWCPQPATLSPTPSPTLAPTLAPTLVPTAAPTMCSVPGSGSATCKGWCPKADTPEWKTEDQCQKAACSTCCRCQEATPAPTPDPTLGPIVSSGFCYHSDCGCPPFAGGAFCCTTANAELGASCQSDEIACSSCAGTWCGL